jgi:hypothetical protein
VYVYHPEQRTQWGDHFFPDGVVLPWTYLPGNFGAGFTPRANAVCSLGQWYCCELMVKANTAGVRNGRIACWLNGALIADFQNLRLRDVDSLTINRFNLSLHSGSNPKRETWKWYDNVVAATSYIGPIASTLPVHRRVIQGAGVRTPLVTGSAILFELTKPGPVSVGIYTLQGVLIMSLVDKTLAAGCQSIRWDGRNGSGVRAAGGMYGVKIETADGVWMTQMAMAR